LLPGSQIVDSEEFRTVQGALEFLIPAALSETYPQWQHESLDGFRFSLARKLGPEEAELAGLCVLISDQKWVPVHLRLRIALESDSVEWFECKLGELGDNGQMQRGYSQHQLNTLLYTIADRLESVQWAFMVTRGSPGRAG